MKKYIWFIFLALFAGCGTGEKFSEYFEVPAEMSNPVSHQKVIDTYGPVMKGVKVFIDPGHGGSERGAQGFVIEAEINLRVAMALKGFLEEAGAIVTMSREKDVTVPLTERSKMANNSGCDIFISVHHNAPGKNEDKITNYTSTYYHALETDYEHNECNRDMARYVQRDMAYAMRNSGGLGSFDGTYSDYMIYPKAGFSVLRLTELPAILVEASFISARLEEQRLANEQFNKIEGWGIFKGLCKYFKNGIPKIEQISKDTISNKSDVLSFLIKDQTGINPKTFSVKIDSVDAQYNFDAAARKLIVKCDGLQPGAHELKITAANNNGNHNFPFRKKIYIVQ